MRIAMGHDALAFLCDVVDAGPAGLAVTSSSEGVVWLPPETFSATYDRRGWRYTATARGVACVEAVRRKDRAS